MWRHRADDDGQNYVSQDDDESHLRLYQGNLSFKNERYVVLLIINMNSDDIISEC